MPRTLVSPEMKTLEELGRNMLEQEMARDKARSQGRASKAVRFDQGRWAFREAGAIHCRNTGLDWEAWIEEWSIRHD